jgi:hypothetical protein
MLEFLAAAAWARIVAADRGRRSHSFEHSG